MSTPTLSDSCDIVLRDGSTVVFRPSTDADVGPVQSFFENLSIESQYQRFFGLPHLDDRRSPYVKSHERAPSDLLDHGVG